MPSGAADLQRGEERVHAAAIGSAGAAQGDHVGRVETVEAAGGGAAGATCDCAGAGAEAAMHPAAAVLHGRLAAAFAGAGPGAAARGGQKVAGRGAIAEPATAVPPQAGGGAANLSGHGNLLRFSGWTCVFIECSILSGKILVVNVFSESASATGNINVVFFPSQH
jgi:hypothetical protein